MGCDHYFVFKARQKRPITGVELSIYHKGKYRKVKAYVTELVECEKCHEEQIFSFYESEEVEDEN